MCLRSIPRRFSGSSPRLWGTEQIRYKVIAPARFIPTPVGNGAPRSVSSNSSTVHPHACGERGFVAQPTKRKSGSSPRLWGTGRWRPMRSSWRRFIPTPVGNGRCKSPRPPRSPVHPHACGERDRRTDITMDPERFIPTPVGNGHRRCRCHAVRAVHPHACGERRKYDETGKEGDGSSPRLWGTGLRPPLGCACWRFIPTPVGNGLKSSRP